MIACEVCKYGYIAGDEIVCTQNCDLDKADDCSAYELCEYYEEDEE